MCSSFRTLQAELGLELPATLVYDYPTVAAISQYISSLIVPSAVTAAAAQHAHWQDKAALPRAAIEPAAAAALVAPQVGFGLAAAGSGDESVFFGVVGTASSTSHSALMVLEGHDATGKIPFNRWEVDGQEQVGQTAVGTVNFLSWCRR